MYSFEGQYRRVPKQNLAGASVQQKKDELLTKAHRDRERREQDRKKLRCATLIKAVSKSYLIRQRVKEEQRNEFDRICSALRDTQHQNRQNENLNEETLNILSSKMIFFYDLEKDIHRLVFLSQKLLVRSDAVILWSCSKINHWDYKFRKLLLFHLKLLTVAKETLATHLRMVDVFTSEDNFAKHVDPNKVNEQLLDVFAHLVKNQYFEQLRNLVEQRVPPMLEPSSIPPTPFAASLIEFIQRPLKLACLTCDRNYCYLALERFIQTYLSPDFSEPIRYFVIPALSKFAYFPYSQLINVSVDILSLKHRHSSSWFLFSVLSLCKDNYLNSCNAEQLKNYLNVLSRLSHNFSKPSVCKMMVDTSDSGSDADDEDSSLMVSKEEVEVLECAKKMLNDYETVQAIISKSITFRESEEGQEIIESIASICYYLLSSKTYGLHEYKLLCSLVLSSQFLKKLWYIITTKEKPTIFGSAATYMNIISMGMELDPFDVQLIVPLITTFCSLLTLLITTLHDDEFYNDDASMIKTSPMPFTISEVARISFVLKELCVGLVELAYPDVRHDLKMSLRHDIDSELSNSALIQNMWSRLFKVVVALLRQLHSRDLRRQFCPDDMWVSTRIKFDRPPDFRGVTARRAVRLFSGMPCYTREDLEDGPPLSTKELRTMAVIREVPFLLPFQERVLVFQNHVLKDKLEHQGEAPYAYRGRSLDVNVRRNYLYEDSFDKLSPANAPNMRYVMRVQLRNAVGVEEAGVDGGGLTREFLSELLKTAFDPNRGFFRLTNDNQLYPNPHVASLHPDFQKHYYFIGRVLGKAMYENLLVELPFAEFFLSKLVSRHSDVSIHHLASLDPVMYKNLLFLKNYEGNAGDLGLDFTVVIDELGETKVRELKPNGSEITVTNENKIEYIHLVADYKLNKQIAPQNTAFKNGLADMIQPQWLHMFSNKELQILISGAEIPIDVADLKRHAKYSGGYHEDHNTIRLFWKVLNDFDDKHKRLLLKFVTSCSRQPLFGFRELDPPFCIQKAGSTDRLPTASTCMNLLKMPEFDTYDMLKDRLLYAIQSGAGFELS